MVGFTATGNEGSAFVEVLVERSTMADDYKVNCAKREMYCNSCFYV